MHSCPINWVLLSLISTLANQREKWLWKWIWNPCNASSFNFRPVLSPCTSSTWPGQPWPTSQIRIARPVSRISFQEVSSYFIFAFHIIYWGNTKQWGSEYRPFGYRKHLNTKLLEVPISNGLGSICFVWCTWPTIQILGPGHKKLRWRLFVCDMRPSVWSSHIHKTPLQMWGSSLLPHASFVPQLLTMLP